MRELILEIRNDKYVAFMPAPQEPQARLFKKLKPELRGAKISRVPLPAFKIEFSKIYNLAQLQLGIISPLPVAHDRLRQSQQRDALRAIQKKLLESTALMDQYNLDFPAEREQLEDLVAKVRSLLNKNAVAKL